MNEDVQEYLKIFVFNGKVNDSVYLFIYFFYI